MYNIGTTLAIQYCQGEDSIRSGGVGLDIKIQNRRENRSLVNMHFTEDVLG